jgi:hypothetical protein
MRRAYALATTLSSARSIIARDENQAGLALRVPGPGHENAASIEVSFMTSNAKRIGAAAILMSLALTFSAAAWGQSAAIPQPWIAYAQLAGQQFQAWLEADNDAADALHTYLEQRHKNAKGDASLNSVVVRAWFGADGTVTRVAFDSLGDPNADANLRQLLTARPMTEPPPPDMRQPLRVQLQLEENPDADDDDSPDAPPMPGENAP